MLAQGISGSALSEADARMRPLAAWYRSGSHSKTHFNQQCRCRCIAHKQPCLELATELVNKPVHHEAEGRSGTSFNRGVHHTRHQVRSLLIWRKPANPLFVWNITLACGKSNSANLVTSALLTILTETTHAEPTS